MSRVLAAHRPDDGLLAEEGTARPGSLGRQVGRRPARRDHQLPVRHPSVRGVRGGRDRRGDHRSGIVVDPSAAGDLGGRRRLGRPPQRPALPGGVRPVHPGDRPGRDRLRLPVGPPGVAGRRWRPRSCPGSATSAGSGRPRSTCAGPPAGATTPTTSGDSIPWDLAAGALICAEAGGRVETFPGRLIVATTPELFDPFCALLADAGATDIPAGPSRSTGRALPGSG